MKTVFFANIDGFDIVLGIGDAIRDPVATAQVIQEPLKSSSEVQALLSLNSQIDANNTEVQTWLSKIQYAKVYGQPIPPDAKTGLEACANRREALLPQFGPIGAAIDARRSALMEKYAVWCQPGPGEHLISEDQAEELMALAGPGVKVTMAGKTIADNRGQTFWVLSGLTWASTTITNLGVVVPSGTILQQNLTQSQQAQITGQLEAERVSTLSPQEKLAEATGAQQQAKASVSNVQTEIAAGVSTQDALTSAVAAYKTALAGINAKYSTNLT